MKGMAETYHVRLEKDDFVFAAAHFITYDGNVCEPIHGHNYGVFAEIEGALDENHYVIDFVAATRLLGELLRELDHHVMLPTRHAMIQVDADEREVTASFGDRRWVFPRDECALLPVANTTAEAVARYVGERFLEGLRERLGARPLRLRLGIDECRGQWGIWEWRAE